MRMTRICEKWFKTGIVLLFLTTLYISGCSKDMGTNSGGTGSPGQNEVWMQSNMFNPTTLNVSIGTTVKWTNKDNVNHTVTSGAPGSPTGLFDSGNINANGTFSYTFTAAGTYQYYCKIHAPMMTGTVVVK